MQTSLDSLGPQLAVDGEPEVAPWERNQENQATAGPGDTGLAIDPNDRSHEHVERGIIASCIAVELARRAEKRCWELNRPTREENRRRRAMNLEARLNLESVERRLETLRNKVVPPEQTGLWVEEKLRLARVWKRLKAVKRVEILDPPHRLTKEQERTLMDARTQEAALKDRTPEVWLERVLQLPEVHQSPVARIVWWDYFAERTQDKRWPHLDRWLDWDGRDARNRDLIEGLVRVGYAPIYAWERVMGGCLQLREIIRREAGLAREVVA